MDENQRGQKQEGLIARAYSRAWKNVEKAYADFLRYREMNPFCLGVKSPELTLHEMISGTIEHFQRMSVSVCEYHIESWGRLAGLEYQRDELQSYWENFGLVGSKEWLEYKRYILAGLEHAYNPRVEEHTNGVRRKFEKPVDSIEYEEQLLEDLIIRTGDLPKVMYVIIKVNNHLFEFRTVFKMNLDGLGLKWSDKAILYSIEPYTYRRLKKSIPKIKEIERFAEDLQSIFNAGVYYYPGWDVINQLNIKPRWYKAEEFYRHH